jgi:hypothetical protein
VPVWFVDLGSITSSLALSTLRIGGDAVFGHSGGASKR